MRQFILSALFAVLVAGCAGPVVAIRHTLPPALPLDGQLVPTAGTVRVVEITPPGRIDPDAQQRSLEGCLAAHLPTSENGEARPTVDGKMYLTITDHESPRTLRGWDADTGETTTETVASLVREVSMRVDFTVRKPDGTELGQVEVRRSYNSSSDAAVRGELGLGRPDDPARVPSPEKILAEQCRETAEELASLVSPVEVAADIELLPVGGEDGAAGLAAAEAGDFDAAVDAFKAVLASREDANAQFSLAVVAEAAGQLQLAEDTYEAVVQARKLPPEKLAIADTGRARARRVRQVLSDR